MARLNDVFGRRALMMVIGVALIAACFGSSSSRLTLGFSDSTIPYEEVSQPIFESGLRGVLFTPTDAHVVSGNLIVPYGSVGLTLPSNWSATPVYQVYNLASKSLVQELTLADYQDYMAASASPNYLVLSRANGISRAYSANPAAPVYGYVDIHRFNTSSTYAQANALHSIRIGQFDATRPFYESAAQSLLAVGISEDQKYVFFNYEAGVAADLAALKYARVGIIDIATGSIVAEIDVPESAHPFYEFAIAPHGAKFVQLKNNVYTFVFSYRSASLVAGYPVTTKPRIMVAQFNSATGSLAITDWETLPSEAHGFDISSNNKYIAVGGPYTGNGQLFTNLAASPSVDPTNNLRVYRLDATAGTINYQGGTAYEADISHVEYSPSGDRLIISSTLSFGVGGLDATAAVALYKVRSSGSAFDLLDSKQIGPIASAAAWATDSSVWTIGQPNQRFKNLAQWNVV